MFELDLSIRECAREDTDAMDVECPRESYGPTKKRPSIQCDSVPGTPPELKRLRFEMESALKEPKYCSFARESRPSTPSELIALRAAIEEEDESPASVQSAHPLPLPLPISSSIPSTSLKERWRHAGLMSDVGGIKKWLCMQREIKETGVR